MASDSSSSEDDRSPLEKDDLQQFIEFIKNWITRASPPLSQAARYAALVHTFDPALMSFLRDRGNDTADIIGRLERSGLIVAVSPARYSFEPSLRQPYLHLWQTSEPETYRRESARAAEYYRSRQMESEIDRIEYVYHLLGADESSGLQALRQEVERMLAEYRLGLVERVLQYANEQELVLGEETQTWLRLFDARLELAHYHYERSEEILRSILTAEVEPRLRAEALMYLANALVATRRWMEALENLDEALQIFLNLGDRFKAAIILKTQGTTYLDLVSSLGGLQRHTPVLQPLYQKWFYRIAFAPFLLYRWLSRRIDFLPSLYFGTDYQDWIIFRLLYQAIQYFEKASSQLAEKSEETGLRDTELLTDIQIYLADLYHRVGQWTKAARLFQILVNAPPVNYSDYRRATLQLARGRASLAQSSFHEAREFLLDARRIFIQYSDHRALATTTHLLGDTEVAANKPNDSVPFYAESAQAALTVDDLLESTHIWSTIRLMQERLTFSPDLQSQIDVLEQKLNRRAYLIRFRSALLQRFRNLAARLAANVVLPLVYLVMLIVAIPDVRWSLIGVTTGITCWVMPNCDTLVGDLVGSALAILAPILLAIWAYGFFYLILGWIGVRRLPLGDITQLQTEFVATFPTGITLRDETGQLKELPWDKVESHISANHAFWRVPIALFSQQFLIGGANLSIIDGIAYHYQSLRQDITERLEQTKNTAVQHAFDYAFFTRPWTIITLLLVIGLTTISILDLFDSSLCRKPNIISVIPLKQSFVYVSTDKGSLHVVSFAPYPILQTDKSGFYQLPGVASGVAVKGNYVYVADGTDGLRIVDVSDPAHPSEVGFQDTPGQASGVAVKGNYVYVADGTDGLRIVDISDPTHPSEVGSQDTPGQAASVSIEENIAYIADGTQGLRVIYLLDLSAEVVTTEGSATNAVVLSDLVFIAAGNKGLLAIDVSNSCSEGYSLDEAEKIYLPMEGLISGVAVPEAIKRPISSISFEFFFWALLLFPIIGLTRLIYNRVSLRRINSQLVLGSDRPFWLALVLLVALAVFSLWTLTWS